MKKTIITLIIALGCFSFLEAQSIQKPERVYKRYTYADIFNNDTITEEMTLEGTFHYNIHDLVSSYECSIQYGSYGNEYYRKNYWYDNDSHIIKYSFSGYDGGGIIGDDSVYYVYDNDLLSYSKKLYVNKWGGWYYTDSVAYYYYDDGSLKRKEQYGRNPDDLHWPSNPSIVTEIAYDETGADKIKTETQIRNGKVYYRKTSHYDLNDHITYFLNEGYNGYDYLWAGYTIAYGYENGLCQTKTRQKWVVADSCWVNDSSFVFQYNDIGIRTEELAQIWVNNEWQNTQRTRWEVDEDDTMLSITYEVWTDSLFTNSKRVEYQYENGQCIGLVGLVWSGDRWVYGIAGVNGVGGNNERIFWDESLSTEDNLIRATHYSFTNTTIIWQTLYEGIDEKEEKTKASDFTVYPNPANGVLFVETVHAPSLPDQTYRITNLMGQTVLSGNITAETQQINIASLPAGMYFIIFAGETRKFVVR